MTFASLGGRENFGRLGRAAAVTCLVIGTVHRIHVSLHVIRQGMSRAIHWKPFSFSRLSILAYVHSPFNDHGEPVSGLLDRTLRLKAAFVRFFCPSIICIVSRSLSHWKWPGHGSSRRPRHQRHWSRNRWGADQPFGSDCPWQPWRNGRLSIKGYLSSQFSPFSTFSNLRNLERLALVFASRKSEAPWLGGVLPVKQPCYLFHAMD